MSNVKGFTLLETLFVLSCVVLVMLIFPIHHKMDRIHQKQELMMLYDFLLQAQCDAMKYHCQNDILLNHHLVQSNYQSMQLQFLELPYQSFHFNAKGHISRALTISFYQSDFCIVAQLGSGSLDIR